MDGDPDFLPLTSAIPSDLTGKTLVTMEQLYPDGVSGRIRSSISIVSDDGGELIANPIASDPFGLVTIVMSRLTWDDGMATDAQLLNPEILIYENGEVRTSTAPIYVTGTGELTSPWRVISSIPGDEFGEATDRVEVVFDTVPEPNAALLMLLAAGTFAAGIRRR